MRTPRQYLAERRAARKELEAQHAAKDAYRQQINSLQVDGTTLPRARYILEQQQALSRDTPFDQGIVRATADYVRSLELPAEPDSRTESPEPEAGQ